jgi:hypothetical protein
MAIAKTAWRFMKNMTSNVTTRRCGGGFLRKCHLRCYELNRDERVRNHYQSRLQYILIDEFQDTNKLQYQCGLPLAVSSARWAKIAFAVGDDINLIYGFAVRVSVICAI